MGSKKMSRWTLPLLLAAITLSAEYVQAQAPPQPVKIGPVTLTGNFRTRVETWDWFKDGAAENAYAFSGSLLRLTFGQQTRNFDWQAEQAAPPFLRLPHQPPPPLFPPRSSLCPSPSSPGISIGRPNWPPRSCSDFPTTPWLRERKGNWVWARAISSPTTARGTLQWSLSGRATCD